MKITNRRWSIVVFILVLGLGSAAFAAEGEEVHRFQYKPDEGAPAPVSVSVAGTFNGWSMNATPMTKQDDGTWIAEVKLPHGVSQYKFVVNGSQWVNDAHHSDKELEEGDGHGGKNSAVMIGPDWRKYPATQPNHINAELVAHDPASITDVNVASNKLLKLRVRVQAGDVDSVQVHYGNAETKEQGKTASMHKIDTRLGLDTFVACIETSDAEVEYVFGLADGKMHMHLASNGLAQQAQMGAPFRVKMRPAFATPDWAKTAVWYQIFPERFRNGDTSNDPPKSQKWTSKWFATLPGEADGNENFYKGKGNIWHRRYGGDVQGLIESLPYLKSLGVTAIYLNPMFEAESMHKYDTADFRHIDDNFGVVGDIAKLTGETEDPATWQWTPSDKLFLEFVAKAHAQGMKVILDGVFNHTGREFFAFQDVMAKGKDSKYAEWFDVRDWTPPIKYIAWDRGAEPSSDGALPAFKKDAKLGLVHGPREYVLAIAKRWLAPDGDPSRGVDGFRLDVPGDIPHPFWVDFRNTVKSTKPDAYISGEIWDWAEDWLKGDQFDAVMNYQFATAAQEFFVNQKKTIAPSQFGKRMSRLVYDYPFQVALVQMNLFDSHDTDRLASMFVNPDLSYDSANRIQDNGPQYKADKPTDEQWARMKQAVAMQMTFVGAPMIYYGDEAGMWSPDDPSNRQPMIWKELEPYDDSQVAFKADLFDWYRKLIQIRKDTPVLSLGSFRVVRSDDENGTFAFARELGNDRAYVIINRFNQSRQVAIPVDGSAFRERVSDKSVRVELKTVNMQLAPYGTAILTAPKP